MNISLKLVAVAGLTFAILPGIGNANARTHTTPNENMMLQHQENRNSEGVHSKNGVPHLVNFLQHFSDKERERAIAIRKDAFHKFPVLHEHTIVASKRKADRRAWVRVELERAHLGKMIEAFENYWRASDMHAHANHQ